MHRKHIGLSFQEENIAERKGGETSHLGKKYDLIKRNPPSGEVGR